MDKHDVAAYLEHIGATLPAVGHGWRKMRCPFQQQPAHRVVGSSLIVTAFRSLLFVCVVKTTGESFATGISRQRALCCAAVVVVLFQNPCRASPCPAWSCPAEPGVVSKSPPCPAGPMLS